MTDHLANERGMCSLGVDNLPGTEVTELSIAEGLIPFDAGIQLAGQDHELFPFGFHRGEDGVFSLRALDRTLSPVAYPTDRLAGLHSHNLGRQADGEQPAWLFFREIGNDGLVARRETIVRPLGIRWVRPFDLAGDSADYGPSLVLPEPGLHMTGLYIGMASVTSRGHRKPYFNQQETIRSYPLSSIAGLLNPITQKTSEESKLQ